MTKLDTAKVREELPATSATAYLNTGTYGPLPRRTAKAIYERATHDLEAGRISGGMASFMAYFDELSALRANLAKVVGADPDEIAITRSTTEGVNLGIWGQEWKSTDEVVTTSQEHPGITMPLGLLSKRYGVKLTFADVGHGGADQTIEAIKKAIHPGVKMVCLSHVLYTTGATLPLKEVTEIAHAAGALVHVDAAQSAGSIPVDVHDLGIDYYAFPGQKWLCGPDGSGGFYVKKDRIDSLSPTMASFMTIDRDSFGTYDPQKPETFILKKDASRYETGTMFRPAVLGYAASVKWITDELGLSNALSDIGDLSAYCHQGATEIPGATVLTPADQQSGLTAIQVGDGSTDEAVEFLRGEGISIRNIHENNALRVSTGFYNTKEEVDLVLEKIQEWMKR